MTSVPGTAGINKQLRAKGIKEGDTVVIGAQSCSGVMTSQRALCMLHGERRRNARALLGTALVAGHTLCRLSLIRGTAVTVAVARTPGPQVLCLKESVKQFTIEQ